MNSPGMSYRRPDTGSGAPDAPLNRGGMVLPDEMEEGERYVLDKHSNPLVPGGDIRVAKFLEGRLRLETLYDTNRQGLEMFFAKPGRYERRKNPGNMDGDVFIYELESWEQVPEETASGREIASCLTEGVKAARVLERMA